MAHPALHPLSLPHACWSGTQMTMHSTVCTLTKGWHVGPILAGDVPRTSSQGSGQGPWQSDGDSPAFPRALRWQSPDIQ